MGSYVMNFAVYTLAMTGLIFFALYIYKKVMAGGFCTKTSKDLSIEETLNINPRKTLMIVKAGDERFLIASDVDKTSLIAKLENANKENIVEINTLKRNLEQKPELPDIKTPKNMGKEIELQVVKAKRKFNSETTQNSIKDLAKKINEL